MTLNSSFLICTSVSTAAVPAQNPSEASVQSAESEEADDGFDLALLEGEVLSSLQEMELKSEEGMLSTDSAVY